MVLAQQVYGPMWSKKKDKLIYISRLSSTSNFEFGSNFSDSLDLHSIAIVICFLATVRVCVDDGWFMQPHLTRVSLIGLWGWVRLRYGCALRNHWTQVKPAITTHSSRYLAL